MCSLRYTAANRMNRVEWAINLKRTDLHRKVRAAINQFDPTPQEEESDTIELT